MPKRKAKDDVADGDWKSGSASFKSGSRSGGGSGSEVLVPTGTNIVWQLEEEAKDTWHLYTDEVQVSDMKSV